MFSESLQHVLLYVPLAFFACFLSLLLTRLCIFVLPMFGMVDIPRGRHQHERIVPRGGGIAMILSFSISILLTLYLLSGTKWSAADSRMFLQLMPPVAIMGILGVLDDRYELKSIVKLLVQIAVGFYFYFMGVGIYGILGCHFPMWFSLPLTICWVIGIINAFNLIDGMDGVAAGLAVISSFSMAVWLFLTHGQMLLCVTLLIFCGTCLGFLRYNFSPAKIFMGDTGSLFIGTFFAFFSMTESANAITIPSLLVPILAMGIPIFDVFLAILRRLFRKYIKKEPGVGIMTGDHDHLHHRIQGQLQDQKKTAWYLYFLAILLVGGGICAALVSNILQTLSFAVILVIIFIVVRLATIEFYDAAALISSGIRIPHRKFILTAVHPVTDAFLLLCAYLLTALLFQRDINLSSASLKQIVCFLAPYPIILGVSGIYKTYWLRAGINRFYRLFLVLLLSSVVALALALGLNVLENKGIDRSQIAAMREFFVCYVLMGIFFIFVERFLLHYMESYNFRRLNCQLLSRTQKIPKTVLYGGGMSCRMFLVSQNSVAFDELIERDLVGIVDDNPSLRGLNVFGLDVLGTSADLEKLYRKYHFTEIVVTLSQIPEKTKSLLEDFQKEKGISVHMFQYGLLDIKNAPCCKDDEEEEKES